MGKTGAVGAEFGADAADGEIRQQADAHDTEDTLGERILDEDGDARKGKQAIGGVADEGTELDAEGGGKAARDAAPKGFGGDDAGRDGKQDAHDDAKADECEHVFSRGADKNKKALGDKVQRDG